MSPTGDFQCLTGAETTGEPGALLRGSDFGFGNPAVAGPLSINGGIWPSHTSDGIGFRCTR